MEDLQKLVEKLQERHHALEQESSAVYKQLEEAQERLDAERLKNIGNFVPDYTRKLERLKVYIEGFVAEYRGHEVNYAFRKREEPYKGDFHELLQDPLDYLIGEYDCLGMTKFLEIVFEYHNPAVKSFVEKWMNKNVKYATPYSDPKELYNSFFSKK